MEANDASEALRKTKDLADMMVSMHAMEGERYERNAMLSTWLGLVLSLVLLTVVFVPSEAAAQALGISSLGYAASLGISAVVGVVLSLVPVIMRPSERAAGHAAAAQHYTAVKQASQDLLRLGAVSQEAYEGIREQYGRTTRLPKISNGRFLKLKQRHRLKVALSQELDTNFHKPVWKLRRELRRKLAQGPSSTERSDGSMPPPNDAPNGGNGQSRH